MFGGEARLRKLCLKRCAVGELAAGMQSGKTAEDVLGQVEGFPNFAHRAFAPVGDDVCGHRRTVFAETAVDFLNHAFAPGAAGQVQIDVGPAGAPLREKPLK